MIVRGRINGKWFASFSYSFFRLFTAFVITVIVLWRFFISVFCSLALLKACESSEQEYVDDDDDDDEKNTNSHIAEGYNNFSQY